MDRRNFMVGSGVGVLALTGGLGVAYAAPAKKQKKRQRKKGRTILNLFPHKKQLILHHHQSFQEYSQKIFQKKSEKLSNTLI